MDALILAMVAMLLGSADLYLVRAIWHRGGGRADRLVVLAAVTALVVNSAVVVAAGIIAGQRMGVGVLMLFQTFALVGAAAALVWRDLAPASLDRRWPAGGPVAQPQPPGGRRFRTELGWFAARQFGDRNQFLLFGIAALTGGGAWAFVGAMAGLAATLVPLAWWHGAGASGGRGPGVPLGEQRAWWLVRWGAALVLLAFAANRLILAFGVDARWS